MRNRRKNGLLYSAIIMSASIIQCGAVRYLVTALWEEPLHCTVSYLDPSTGAMIISAIVGIFATLLLGLKTFWYKVISLFKRKDTASGKGKENK